MKLSRNHSGYQLIRSQVDQPIDEPAEKPSRATLERPVPGNRPPSSDLSAQKPRPRNAVIGVAQPAHTPPRFMSSGGVRKAENGNIVSFFAREAPASLAPTDYVRAIDMTVVVGRPWRPVRSTLPDALVEAAMQLDRPQAAAQAEPDSGETPRLKTKLREPNVYQRAYGLAKARLEGKINHGWNYEQQIAADGTYAITISRLHVSVKPKNVFGTNISLPTREVELYETHQGQASGRSETLPAEVARTARPGSDIGDVRRTGVVNCHELGNKYLLYRAEKAGTGASGAQRRKLLVHAHGEPHEKEFAPPAGLKCSYYAPHGSYLRTPAWSPAHIPLHAKYETSGAPSQRDYRLHKAGPD